MTPGRRKFSRVGVTLAALGLASCAIVMAQTRPAAQRPSLLAAGSLNRFWIAHVETDRDSSGGTRVRTMLRERAVPNGPWLERGQVLGRAAAMASIQGDAAVLIDDEFWSWKRVGVETFGSGPAVPGSGPVLGWASAPGGLLAVRQYAGGLAAFERQTAAEIAATEPVATRPAASRPSPGTRSSAPAIAVSTAPSSGPVSAVLFKFERGRWIGLADLPAGVADKPFSLGAMADRIVLAVQSEPAVVRSFSLEHQEWRDWGSVRAGAAINRFELIVTPGAMLLWMVDQNPRMLLARREAEGWNEPRPLTLPDKLPERMALAAVGEELRLVLFKDQKLWEQRYDFAGMARGNPAELPQATSNEPSPFAWVAQSLMLLAVVLIVVAALRRRSQNADKPEDGEGGGDRG